MKTRLVEAGENADDIVCPQVEIPSDLLWLWRAWWRLNDSRPWIGGGMSTPIPKSITFSAVVEWANYYNYDEEMTYMLDNCAKELDKVYIGHVLSKAQK